MARAALSTEPPLISQNPVKVMPGWGGRSRVPRVTQASTTSLFTKVSTSVRNCASYSALFLAGSCSICSSTHFWLMDGFIVRVAACQTSVGSPSLAKCLEYAFHSAPRRAYGDEAQSSIASGIVAILGWIAARTSLSGSADFIACGPEGKLVEERGRYCITARRFHTGGMSFNRDLVFQRDALARLAFDELFQNRAFG